MTRRYKPPVTVTWQLCLWLTAWCFTVMEPSMWYTISRALAVGESGCLRYCASDTMMIQWWQLSWNCFWVYRIQQLSVLICINIKQFWAFCVFCSCGRWYLPGIATNDIYLLVCRLKITGYISESGHNRSVGHWIILITFQVEVTRRYRLSSCYYLIHLLMFRCNTVGRIQWACTVLT